MKKLIITVLLMVIMSVGVAAWGATRTISDNDVTINVDVSDGTGIFTIQETISEATIREYPRSACGLAENVLTCDYEDKDAPITYKTDGSGTISGVIVGGYPATEMKITGRPDVPFVSETFTPPAEILPPADTLVTCDYNDDADGVCASGILSGATCTAPATYEETEETCDSLDNDCDGEVDEGDVCAGGSEGGGGGGAVDTRCDDVECTAPEECYKGECLQPDKIAYLTQMEGFYDTAEGTTGDGTGWTLSLFSRIANYLRGLFS